MIKILVICNYGRSLLNFRGEFLHALRQNGAAITTCAPSYDLETTTFLNSLDAEIIELPLSRAGYNPLSEFKCLIRLYKIIKTNKFDIVFSYTMKPVVYSGIARNFLRFKYYPYITGLGFAFTNNSLKGRIINKILSFLLKQSLKNSETAIFQNYDDLKELNENGILSKNHKSAITNGSGVNLAKYPYSPTPATNGSLKFLMVARILKDKGVVEFLKAAKSTKVKYPNVEFKLVGPLDDNPSAICSDFLDQYSKFVEYVGPVDTVYNELTQCHIFVLPSYREGTPRSTLEALAVGRAIITTNAPGCRETVVNLRNGLLVEPRNSKELSEAFNYFIENPSIIDAMGEESYKIACDKYDVRKVNAKLLGILGINER